MRFALPIALLAACTTDATQLVVVLGSDLRVPDEIDAISIEVTGRGDPEDSAAANCLINGLQMWRR